MKTDNGFQLHWVNNKELQFTMESEKILQEMHKSSLYDEHARHQSYESQTDSDSDPPDTDEQPDYGKYSKTCLKRAPQKITKIGFQDRLSLNAG